MTNKKTNRRALLLSVISLILCCAMLVGTTMAWFTDAVSSTNNVITAGNLDIELEYKNDEQKTYAPVGQDTNVFKKDALWEPGHVEVANLRLSNLGTLALKYQFKVNVLNEIGSVNAAGDSFKLSDHIRFALIDGDFTGSREEAVAAAESKAVKVNGMDWTEYGAMMPEATEEVTLVVWMPEDVDNIANYRGTRPEITLGLELLATQVTNEYDSFGNNYDADAIVYTQLYSFEQEADLAAFEPTPADGVDNTGLTVKDGVAVINAPGAWYGLDADLANYSYGVSYELDITALEEGKHVTVDTGEATKWGSTPIYIERGSAKVYYGLAKNEYIGELTGTKLTVSHRYSLDASSKLTIKTVVSDGSAQLEYSRSFDSAAQNKLYWDIYHVDEAGKATMDNFCITTYKADVNNEPELKAALEAAVGTESVIELSGNITLSGTWTPIGDKDAGEYFTGTLDGNGYTIEGLSVESGDYVALISAAKDAVIKDLTVKGSVAGDNPAGIVARAEGTTVIENCVNYADITAATKAGGIVCNVTNAEDVRIINCVNYGTVSGSGSAGLGGIVGYVNNNGTVSIENCANHGAVTSTANNWAGAAIGYAAGTSQGKIYGFTNTGSVTGKASTDQRILKQNGTVLAAYCATPDNWEVSTRIDGIDYVYSGNDTILYTVTSEFAGSTVNVPEGVTTIGSRAFAANQNVEKIVLPSTVTKLNDRAFRDTSASTVVLNEGLTNISYQAFRNALNVTSVVIPSTVTTISKEAFQNSGITELTVPATVTTIEYGAMRDMKLLETVTIESNADIPVYAFRACTNLRTVTLKGDDVTFGGGSRGMIFTNKENGDGSAITIYVANETVKERLLAADTAAKDYGGYKIVVSDSVSAWEDLNIVTGDTTVKDAVAEEYVEICHKGGALTMENVTFRNGLTIYTTEVDNAGSVTLKNCTIYLNDGTGDPAYASRTQYKADYGVNLNLVNGSDITFKFEGCTFTAAADHAYTTNSGYNVYIGGGYSAKSVTFTGCTFEQSAKHGIGCSSEAASQYYTLNVTGCNFKNWNNNAANGAAIRGNLPGTTFAADITISNNTFGNNNGSTQNTVAIDSWTGSWN